MLCLCIVQVFIRSDCEDEAEMRDNSAADSRGVAAAVLTTEYDVFACESFMEDAGKWARLMPDAGFLPT